MPYNKCCVSAASLATILLCAACDTGSSASEPLALPSCDPVAPRPPCDPRPPNPSLTRVLTIVDGDGQVAEAGSLLPKPLTVAVTNGNNQAVANAKVKWSSLLGITLSDSITTTNASGITSVQLRLANGANDFYTTAEVMGSAAAKVQFVSAAELNGAFRLKEKLNDSGQGQSDSVNAHLARPYKLTVVNFRGDPVAGVTVQWSLEGAGSLSSFTTVTDEIGVAQVTHTLGPRVGLEMVQASATGLLGSPVGFYATVRPGRPVTLANLGGDGQLGVVNSEAPQAYSVSARDAYGNLADANIDWSVESGGGSIRVLNSFTVMHKLGPVPGPQSVVASLRGTSQRVAFTANAVSAIVSPGDCYYYSSGFYPGSVNIPVGGVVAFVWHQGYCDAHNVTFEDDPASNSPTVPSLVFTRTFTTAGTVRYRCTLHSTGFGEGEVGVINVQ